ncbi:hypothetical protein GGI12_001263 [Dipsacomyces acuminosporus]|nr:hypothetical protein GGI12_001263 [Dipsacomyces acuminosporus]
MLPTIRAQAEGTISDTVCWQPASLQPDPLTNAILQEVGSPVTLRPATRVPGFLAESKNGNYKEMARQFEKLHKDLDIPHDLLSGAFKEAATDSAWDSSRYTEGSLISCCRPALGSQLLLEDVNADADREWYTAARFRKDVKPICDFSPGDGDGDGYDADEYSTGYGWSSHREWALYAGGECNNELWAAPLPAAGDEGDTFPSLQFRPNRGQSAQKTEVRASIEFTTSIKQIITNNLHPGFACVYFLDAPASKESSRIETFIYGQHSDDVPYISIEQSMLKQSTGASSVQETIQEALAIDPMENAKMTIGHGHVDRYTTPHLTGFAFCIMPQTPDPQALDDGVSAAIDAVCVVIDELGALIGHQLQIMASANTNTTGTNTTGTDTIYTPVFKSSIWQNSRVYEQAVIDGMGLVLMDKAAVDERRESYWSELRGRGMRYDRVDLQQVYQYLVQDVRSETGGLVQTANGEVADYSSLTRKAQSGVLKKIADMASRPISAYDISSAVISVLSSNGAGLAKELPSWTEDGKRIREVLLSLDPETLRERWRSGGLSELMEIVCEKASACRDKDNNGANNNDKDDDEHIQQALCSKFASASLSNSLTKASIGRASSDIKLANVRLQLAEGKGAQERAASEQTAQSSDPVSELESKLGTLSSHAGLLNDQWLNGAIADSSQTQQPPMPYGAGSQVSQARKRKSRPSQPAYTNSQTQTPGRVLAPESLRSTISARMSQPLFQSGRFEVVPETQFTSSMQSAFGASQFTQATADYFSAASAARPAQSLRSRTSQSQAKKKTRRSGF